MVMGVVAALAASQIAFAANGAPSTYGDIYRVAPTGAVTNLTHDPAADVFPNASPDGKRVAFARQRAHSVQIEVVGSDGRGLRAVSPQLAGGGLDGGVVAAITWAPDSRRLAVLLSRGGVAPTLFLTSLRGGWRTVERYLAYAPPAWSADGRLVAVTSAAGLVDVVDAATGRRVWRAPGARTSAWSERGQLLAVHANSTTITIYDERGRERASFPGGAFAWSGQRLASLRGGVLELRDGAGRPTARVALGRARPDCDCAVAWVGTNRVRVRTGDATWTGYDFARRRRLPGGQPFGTVWSATGLPAFTRSAGTSATLVRGATAVRTGPSCGDDEPFPSVQFVGRTTALVYQSGCRTPSADVYTVAGDGTALRRVTQTPTDELSPALSPDRTRIAYSQQTIATFCNGCAHNLWVTPGQELTKHDDSEVAPFDDSPSFSPDGTQLAFVRSGPDSRPTLFTVPVAGGTARDLGIANVSGQIAWGKDGIAYATGYGPASIRVVDPATGAVKTRGTEGRLDVVALAWSLDGRLAYLATGGGRASISIVGGRTIRLAQHRVTGLAWSPDGTRFAYVADDANGYGEVWTIGVDGKGARQVTRNLGVVGTLSWR